MTRSLRDFVPLTENTVNMYVCGPTVYNYIHIGNARSTVAFDTIRRYFEYRGYTVNYISNCAALTIYEVLRQQDYPNLSKVEVQKGEEFLYDL